MGYSTSTVTIENRAHLLGSLQEGKPCRWRTEPGNENHLAYQIREALHVAKLHPEEYPGLARASKEFSIEIAGRGMVRARKLSEEPDTLVVDATKPEEIEEVAKDEPLTEHGPQTALSIIQIWLDVQPFNGKLVFPEAQLDPDSLTKLYRWTQKKELLLFASESGTTLMPDDGEIDPDLAWNPSDLEE